MRPLLRAVAVALTRATGPRPQPSRRSLAFDIGLAFAMSVATVLYAHVGVGDQDVAFVVGTEPGIPPSPPDQTTSAVVVAVVAAAALVFRRRYPLAVLWVVLAATMTASTDEPSLTFLACVIAAFSAAAYSPYRVPTLASVAGAAVLFGVFVDSVFPVVPAEYAPLIVLVPIAVAADGLRRWKLRADERSARLAEFEREQAEALRRAAEDERARIARELHDVVTHNVSVMVIQAGAARKVMEAAPERAGEALLAVESGGRAALAELRQVMGLLTTDNGDDEAAELAPQPTLASLSNLVTRLRDAGMDVDLTVRGRERPLPGGIELAAYRVVQEALTNTAKHASGAWAGVTVDYGDDELLVAVVDTAGTAGEAASSGNGRGLIGLRERLAVYGGTLVAGRTGAGGYQVAASIPLEGA
ncbi:signal transduction histidine kinase [Haloactinopolyspora alba]|uniref:histidine kinase n=1 Tax=Haloactinopolyspora alba TaxID=648780 RepID=A0A2P8E578_9ACTN|nr:histidine kinase [Haloactinopolyspora alba]PSL04626.1 signal transduction histidine kinase [Haloactinopolyspora alba]